MTTEPKEIRDGRQLVRDLSPRSAGSDYALASALGVKEGAYPSIFEDTDFITFLKGLRIRHTTPELRLEEVDQVDPAGRFRQGASGDIFYLERSSAANWANALGSNYTILFFRPSDNVLEITSKAAEPGDLRLIAGISQANMARIILQSSLATPNINFEVASGGSFVSRLQIVSGNIEINSSDLDLNSNPIKGLRLINGDGGAALTLRSHAALTDATARRIALYALDPATDTEYIVANIVPKAATPMFTFMGSDYVPTTAELDAGHYYVGYTKATDTATLYMNEGGVVKTLVLGVMV